MAARIKSRAIERCGVLLKEYDGRPTNATKQTNGSDNLISRYQAGHNAGLSDRQINTAVRVANLPKDQFEAPSGSSSAKGSA